MATYYVSPTGDDTADGSVGTPWKTPHQALRYGGLAPGDVVELAAGTYNAFKAGSGDTQIVSVITVACGDTPVTIRAASDAEVTVDIPATALTYFIRFGADDYLRFENIKFTNSNAVAVQGFRLPGDCALYLDTCDVDHGGADSNIITSGGTDKTITITLDNTALHNNINKAAYETGAATSNVTFKLINGSRIYNVSFAFKSGAAVGTKIANFYGRDSIISHCNDKAIYLVGANNTFDFEGCILAARVQNGATSKDNIIYCIDATASQDYIDNPDHFKFENNKIYRFGTRGVGDDEPERLERLIYSNTQLFPWSVTNFYGDPGFSEAEGDAGDFSNADFSIPTSLTLNNDKVAFCGQSIMHGVGGTAPNKCYLVFSSLSGLSYGEPDDCAIGGLNVEGSRYWVDNAIAKETPRYAFFSLATNNIIGDTPSAATNQNFTDEIVAVMQRAVNWGVVPIWLGIPSIHGGDTGNSNTRVDAINALVEAECISRGWVFGSILDEMRKKSNWETVYYANLTINVHPNDAGHALIGRLAYRLWLEATRHDVVRPVARPVFRDIFL